MGQAWQTDVFKKTVQRWAVFYFGGRKTHYIRQSSIVQKLIAVFTKIE